ncbi:MAG: GNAT family acetyltransferase [Chthoniobacterales bacterium]|nr:GNAT family acetyltransferase [Chthoniobacterales bacterium]
MSADAVIRPYRPSDRETLRRLCCETGYLGRAIDPVFEDRELFSDYLTSFYTDWEPESCFVLEQEGEVKGYLMGSRRPFLHQLHSFLLNISLLARGIFRYPRYNASSKAFVRWILLNAWREVPAAPRRVPHFHFNMLPEAQGIAGTRELLVHYFNHLRAHGEKQVFGQVVTFEDRRGARVFERYGFQVVAKKEITKYRAHRDEPVYLCTVIKDLNDGKLMEYSRG